MIAGLFLLASSLIFNSCNKNEDATEVVTTRTVVDEAVADILWNTIDADVDYVSDLMGTKGFKSVSDTCPMIIVDHPDSAYFPRTVVIDYGDGCETWHGRTKSGAIIIEISRPLHEIGAVRTVTFNDYFVNGYGIEGVKTFTNNGMNDSGNINYQVVLQAGKIVFPDGGEVLREMNHNREWISGIETPRYRWDDEWLIRGTAEGVNRDDVSYLNEITTPVLVKAVCKFPVSGTIDMNITDLGVMVLDYGDGECDNIATITFGDRIWEIELR